jgi:acyl carrier protein
VAVADEVKLVIVKELKISIGQLSDNAKLDELGADSVDLIEIIFALEEKYDIDISLKLGEAGSGTGEPRTGLSAIATVGDVCRAVQGLVDAKTAQ